jgi:acyl carrier protein
VSAALEAKLRAFLCSELGVTDDALRADTPLVSSGLVDSAGLVRLAALLERETGRIIPDKDLTADHFDSIAQILAYLDAA